MEVFPWAFNVVFEDDYDWPERGQTQTLASKRDVVVRVVWVELVLRLGVAARRGTERLVQHLLPQPPEDSAEAAVRVTIVEPETETHGGTSALMSRARMARDERLLRRSTPRRTRPSFGDGNSTSPLLYGG